MYTVESSLKLAPAPPNYCGEESSSSGWGTSPHPLPLAIWSISHVPTPCHESPCWLPFQACAWPLFFAHPPLALVPLSPQLPTHLPSLLLTFCCNTAPLRQVQQWWSWPSPSPSPVCPGRSGSSSWLGRVRAGGTRARAEGKHQTGETGSGAGYAAIPMLPSELHTEVSPFPHPDNCSLPCTPWLWDPSPPNELFSPGAGGGSIPASSLSPRPKPELTFHLT